MAEPKPKAATPRAATAGSSDLEVVLAAIHTELDDDTVAWGLFRTENAVNQQLRRVIWIPTEWVNEPIKVSNPLTDEDGSQRDILTTDEITIEAHITGENFADMCAIRTAVLQAARKVLGPDLELIDGEFRTQLENVAGVMYAGAEKLIQRMLFCLNVEKIPRDEVGDVVTVTSIETEAELDDTVEGTFTQT